MNLPPFVVLASDVPVTQGSYPAVAGPVPLSAGRDLGTAAGTRNLGCWQERLAPGTQTSLPHAHSHEEELVYVLAGSCSLRLVEPDREPREIPLRAGHFVAFPSGTRIAHAFFNHGDVVCELLAVGERRPDVDRVSYPETPALVAYLRETRPARLWEGEPDC